MYNINMQGNKIDKNRLIVSWNRYEQGLMKAYLMKCVNNGDNYCFGNEEEVKELVNSLDEQGIRLNCLDYNLYSHGRSVQSIKNAIQKHLTEYKGKPFSGFSNYSINDNNETQFLTRFAMAIQDTKIRGTYIPESAILDTSKQQTSPNLISANGITIAKAKLLSLATQLTRIGLNCKTTVHNAQNLRGQTKNTKDQRTINFIDTNNFLYRGALQMDKLNIGMEPFKYYFNLYRKLFDLALKREWDQKQSGQQPKIPRFLIPLTGFWDETGTVNKYIKKALDELFKIKYNKTQTYGQLIAVDIVDYNNGNSNIFKDWKHGRVLSKSTNQELFNDSKYEEYAIGSGDHYTFIGNECMDCWQSPSISSHEAFAMKTDFPKFYGQNNGFNMKNGYYIIDPKNFKMPTSYQLHMNYQNDKIVPMNEINKGIKYNTKYGMGQYYKNRPNNKI